MARFYFNILSDGPLNYHTSFFGHWHSFMLTGERGIVTGYIITNNEGEDIRLREDSRFQAMVLPHQPRITQ